LPTKAAIFDLDGTILNTVPDLFNSLNEALTEFKLPTHSLEAVAAMLGNGMGKLIERSLPQERRQADFIVQVRGVFKKVYHRRQCEATKPYPGIEALLEALSGQGWPLAVLSNKDHENTLEVVEYFFPKRFKCILGVSPERPPKPDLTGAKEAVVCLGVEPENIFYFGDSDVDMQIALNCGFHPIGVSWGFRPVEELAKAGAQIILDDPLDFFPYFQKLK
jgi:phosphoglycolate phosphatase